MAAAIDVESILQRALMLLTVALPLLVGCEPTQPAGSSNAEQLGPQPLPPPADPKATASPGGSTITFTVGRHTPNEPAV